MPFDLILFGAVVVVGSGMGFLGRRRSGGLLIIDLGIKALGDGGDLGSLAAEVVGDEEEGEDGAYDGGEQGNGNGGKEGDRWGWIGRHFRVDFAGNERKRSDFVEV